MKKVLIIGAVGAVLIACGASFGIYHVSHKSSQPASISRSTPGGVVGVLGDTTDNSSQDINQQPATTNRDKSSAGDPPANNNALPVSSGDASTAGNQSTAQQSTPSSGPTAIDPASFSKYETYKTSNTVHYAQLKSGLGDSVATSGKTVAVVYSGWLTNGQQFDAQTDPKKPYTFVLGAGRVISGWEQGIAGMKVGEERLLIIPPSLGYGATPPSRSSIPANAVLIFDVKVIAVQ